MKLVTVTNPNGEKIVLGHITKRFYVVIFYKGKRRPTTPYIVEALSRVSIREGGEVPFPWYATNNVYRRLSEVMTPDLKKTIERYYTIARLKKI